MAFVILALFIGVPILEIAVFIEVGGRIGLGPTLATVILTAVIGTYLLRRQGLQVLARARDSLEAERFPLDELFEGLCLVFAGALLLTPGFVTDAVGFLLFVGPFRQALKAGAARYLAAHGQVYHSGPGHGGGRGGHFESGSQVIDGEFSDVTNDGDDDEPEPKRIGER